MGFNDPRIALAQSAHGRMRHVEPTPGGGLVEHEFGQAVQVNGEVRVSVIPRVSASLTMGQGHFALGVGQAMSQVGGAVQARLAAVEEHRLALEAARQELDGGRAYRP